MKARTIIEKLNLLLCAISCVAIVIMMFLMVADAISRKLIGSIPGGYYTTLAILIILLFFSQGYAQLRGAHITIDLVTSRFSVRTQIVLRIIVNLMAVFLFGIMMWAGAVKAGEMTAAKEEWMGAIFYPAWPFRWTVPVGIGAFTLQIVVATIDEIKKLSGRA